MIVFTSTLTIFHLRLFKILLLLFFESSNSEIGWPSTSYKRISKKKVTMIGISGKIQILSIQSYVSRLPRVRSQNCPSAGLGQFYSILSNLRLEKESRVLIQNLIRLFGSSYRILNTAELFWICGIGIFQNMYFQNILQLLSSNTILHNNTRFFSHKPGGSYSGICERILREGHPKIGSNSVIALRC